MSDLLLTNEYDSHFVEGAVGYEDLGHPDRSKFKFSQAPNSAPPPEIKEGAAVLRESELNKLLYLERCRQKQSVPFVRTIRGVRYTVRDYGRHRQITPEAAILRDPSPQPATSKPERQWHLFSQALARKINAMQPDITAAILLKNLASWQDNKYQQTLIQGRRHSFRSLDQLLADHPYLTRSQIYKALNRAEEKLGHHFVIRRDRQVLHFSISESLLNAHKEDEMIYFQIDAAREHGVASAILLGNLKWQLEHFQEPKTDDRGNIFGKLSPKRLSESLPLSEDTIARTISKLVKADALIRHPESSSFFTLKELFEDDFDVLKTASYRPAEVNAQPAEVNLESAEVNLDNEISAPECLNINELQVNDQMTYSNECSNLSCKGNTKLTGTASPTRDLASPSTSLPENAKLLCRLVDEHLQKLSESNLLRVNTTRVHRVLPSNLPYDDFSSVVYDLPYDQIPRKSDFWRVPGTKQWLDQKVQDVKTLWLSCKFKYTSQDLALLRIFLRDNSHLPNNFFEQILSKFHPDDNFLYFSDFSAKKGKYDDQQFLRNVKTAKAFLKYLPQILFQITHYSEIVDGEMVYKGEDEKEFGFIDFSYLGGIPKSKLVQLAFHEI